jgi:hypothetical protein
LRGRRLNPLARKLKAAAPGKGPLQIFQAATHFMVAAYWELRALLSDGSWQFRWQFRWMRYRLSHHPRWIDSRARLERNFWRIPILLRNPAYFTKHRAPMVYWVLFFPFLKVYWYLSYRWSRGVSNDEVFG